MAFTKSLLKNSVTNNRNALICKKTCLTMGIFNCWSILRPRPAICFKNKYFGCLAYNTYIQPIRFYFIPLYMYIFICTSNHTFLNRIFGNKKIKYQRNFCKKHVSIRGLEIDHNFGLGRSDSKYYD